MISGVSSAIAWTAVGIMLTAPGPAGARHTAGWPVTRAWAKAMPAAAISWRTPTRAMPSFSQCRVRSIFGAPVMWKMVETPRAFMVRASSSLAVGKGFLQ